MILKQKSVIIGFILLFVLSLNVVATPQTYQILEWFGSCDNPDECSQALSCCSTSGVFNSFKGIDGNCDKNDGKELPEKFPYSTVSSKGCYIQITEDDDGDPNDCGWVAIKPGKIMGYNAVRSVNIFNDKVGAGWDDDDTEEFIKDDTNKGGKGTGKLFYLPTNELICGEDESWNQCDDTYLGNSLDIVLDSTKPKDKTKFYCLKTKTSKYVWMTADQVDGTVDADGDRVPAGKPGVTDGFLDCDDNDPNRWGKLDCAPYMDPVTKKIDLKKPDVCAIAANKEIIGNGIDEDCDGKDVADADDDEKACTDKNLNVEGDSYFWMGAEVKDANGKNAGCCGDDSEDFGKIFTTNSGEVVCLHSDKNKVGTVEGGIKATVDKRRRDGIE